MKCPDCGYNESKVLDSRPSEENGGCIRRRRECMKCQRRFTTYERIEETPVVVKKKDGSREEFDRGKILNGIVRACEKRPVALSDMEKIVAGIENHISSSLNNEISTAEIGEMVMDGLKSLDEVAYVRFASVYRQFRDVESFMEELKELLNSK